MQKMIHTPEGVRDIYGAECEQKLALQDSLHAVIKSYGYRDIETPTFEFFDVFGNEIGTTPSKDLYKFLDREGNTLVLRPDFTPAVARAVSSCFPDEGMPLRLTYLGNTFNNSSSYQGRLKETTQIGGELISEDSADADAEVIALTVQMLLSSGLQEFQISLGHCGYFDALIAQAGLDGSDAEEIKELITNKNTFGVEQMLSEKPLDDNLKQCLSSLPVLFGNVGVLDRARAMTDNKEALLAIDRLQQIWEALKLYGVEEYVSFDLGLLSRYQYYTGILIRGYTYETGAPILKGGRYDQLLSQFGKDMPAVGFVVEIDQLQSALSRQKILQQIPDDHCFLIYDDKKQAEAIETANNLRRQGMNVEMLRVTEKRSRKDCVDYASRKSSGKIIEL